MQSKMIRFSAFLVVCAMLSACGKTTTPGKTDDNVAGKTGNGQPGCGNPILALIASWKEVTPEEIAEQNKSRRITSLMFYDAQKDARGKIHSYLVTGNDQSNQWEFKAVCTDVAANAGIKFSFLLPADLSASPLKAHDLVHVYNESATKLTDTKIDLESTLGMTFSLKELLKAQADQWVSWNGKGEVKTYLNSDGQLVLMAKFKGQGESPAIPERIFYEVAIYSEVEAGK